MGLLHLCVYAFATDPFFVVLQDVEFFVFPKSVSHGSFSNDDIRNKL